MKNLENTMKTQIKKSTLIYNNIKNKMMHQLRMKKTLLKNIMSKIIYLKHLKERLIFHKRKRHQKYPLDKIKKFKSIFLCKLMKNKKMSWNIFINSINKQVNIPNMQNMMMELKRKFTLTRQNGKKLKYIFKIL